MPVDNFKKLLWLINVFLLKRISFLIAKDENINNNFVLLIKIECIRCGYISKRNKYLVGKIFQTFRTYFRVKELALK